MGRVAKAKRHDEILDAYLDGMPVLVIAEHFGVTQRWVYVCLNDMGVVFHNDRPNDIWSMEETQRRVAITRRASRGASEALKQFSRTSN